MKEFILTGENFPLCRRKSSFQQERVYFFWVKSSF
jgi:hypothetical protein